LKEDIINLCQNAYGSKVVQKIYEIQELEYRVLLSDEILNRNYIEIDKLIKDQYGNHVIQKIIERGYSDKLSQLKES